MKHGTKIKKELQKLSNYQKVLLQLGQQILSASDGSMYPLDFIVIGVVKRSVSIASAFKTLVEDWNMICSRALLRMQIDTAIRLSSFWLVSDPDKMAEKVMDGKQINKLRDKDGRKMTDAYLVDKLASQFKWITKVYKYTSGYIHFSERHLFDPILNINNKTGRVNFLINDKDYKFPEFSWNEIVSCFNECTMIISSFLKGYKESKLSNDL